MSDYTTSAAVRQERAKTELQAIHAMAEGQRAKYESLLPTHVSFDDFRNAFMIAIQRNPRLLDADRQSFWLALQGAAGMGLKPDGREGALVIFGDDSEDEDGNRVASSANKKKIVQWLPMVRGLLQLVRNTGIVAGLRARLVYKGEHIELIDEDGAIHYKHIQTIDPQFEDTPENIIGAYAVVNYKDGTWEMAWMSRRQIDRRRAVSRAKKGPWLPWYDEMSRKTILKHLIKTLPQSPELRDLEKALDADPYIDHDPEEGAQGTATPQIEQHTTIDPLAGLNKPPKETAPKEDPADSSLGTKVATKTEPPKEPPPTTEEVPIFEHFPVDEIGEAVGGNPITTPQGFAEWFEAAAEHTKNIEALRENNMDAIADAGTAPAAALMISEAIAAAVKRTASASAASNEEAKPEPAQPAVAEPLPIPKTPGRKPHWPNYLENAKAVILGIQSEADLAAWRALNRPAYQGSPIEAGVERALRERASAIDPQITPPAGDADAEWATASVEHIKTISYDDAVTWAMGAIPQAKMPRLKAERPELYSAVRDAIDNRRE